ncbi:MAG: peptide ABC transporter ATP-binding protein, partial [Neofamilia sp.]
MTNKILEVKNLETSFYTHVGEVNAVRDVSFSLKEG